MSKNKKMNPNDPHWQLTALSNALQALQVSNSGNSNPQMLQKATQEKLDVKRGSDTYPVPRTQKEKPKLKPEEMDRVVMDSITRDEIIAVLKQHQNYDKLFNEWGLGEVIEYGKGMTFLFYGSPGTGKTWAAHCMAKTIGKDILQIGAAEIQSSEPGAANRNIQGAFKAAKSKDKMLFIDECDSLIADRATVGMVIASEINTLLTCIEKFEGVCVLATNMIEHLDAALERRISLIVEFPEPNATQRREIWERMLPKKLPLHKEVKKEKLAEYKMTGGQIKNVVLQAARVAMAENAKEVTLLHFESAINRINSSKSLMGSASRYRQQMVRDYGIGKDIVKKDIKTDIITSEEEHEE